MRFAWVWTIPFVIALPSIGRASSEDEFFNTYGNHVNDSGVWKQFNKIRNGNPNLIVSVCNQAHELAKIGPPSVNVFAFYTKTLLFKNEKYHPINIDMIVYSVTLPNSTTQIDPRCWTITKGLRADCVYFLQQVDKKLKEFYLTEQHVCGIEYIPQQRT